YMAGSICPVACSMGNGSEPPATWMRTPPNTRLPSRDSTIRTNTAGLYIQSFLDEVTFFTPIAVSTCACPSINRSQVLGSSIALNALSRTTGCPSTKSTDIKQINESRVEHIPSAIQPTVAVKYF